MVSFDVVSLFTKVPLQEAMTHISDLLHADDALEDGQPYHQMSSAN